MSSIMSSALLFLCIFFLFKYSSSYAVVKREADRMASAVCTNASECSVTCGGGCMIQYCRCEDQAGTALSFCGSQPCCSLGDFFNGNNPLSCIPCNMQACPPGGPSSVNGYISHMRTFTLVDSVTGMINVTTTSDTATINITIQVPDPTGYSTHFDTVRTATQISRMGRQTFSAVRYEISNRVVRINGQSLFAAGPFLAVRTIPSTGSFSYMGSAGVYQLGTGSGVATFSGYPTYYYVSPFGHLYEYSGTKAVRDKAPGKVFVRRNPTQNEQLIITSENNFITQELSKLSSAAMSIEPVGGGAAIGLNFRNTGTNAFMITSSTSVNTNVSPTSYTGTTLMVGSMTFNNIETVLLAGEGFERYRSASNEATAFVDYDSFFINGRNAVFSTSPRVTAIVREGQMFLAGGGTAQATYTVEGNRVKYAGVTVFTLNSGFTTRDIPGPGLISYDGQAFTGSATNRGIESFAYNVGTTNGMAFNGDATVSIAPGTNVRLYVSGSEAFATSSQSLINNITAASTPTTIPGSNAVYTTVLGSGNTGILQLNGQNVVSFTGSAMSLTLNNGDAVSYSGGSISLTPANSRGPFNSISRLTYAPTGQDIRQYNPIASETFSVDSSYQLVVDGSGNALLTNDGTVKGLLSNPQFGVTFSNRDGQGNFHLMIGGNNIERMGRNTARHIIPAGGSLRLVGPSLAGIINGNAIFPGVTTTSVQTYFSDDTVPTTIRGSPQPYVRSANTPFYVYITGSTAFITDRATVDAAINNQLMEPSSTTPTQTSTPSPTPTPTPGTPAPPATTAPPATVPPTSGISVFVRNDENGNPIVRAFDRITGTDTNLISLTGSTLRNISRNEVVGYNGPNLFIRSSGGIELLSNKIRRFFYYDRNGILQSRSIIQIPGSGLLAYNDISGSAFYTDDPETIDMIRSANAPTTFSGGITTTTDGSNVLTIGGSETHPITEETTLSVSSVQTIRVSDSGYSVINQDGSIAFSSTGQRFSTLVQYQTSSDQVNVSSLTSTSVEFQGPQTISVSSDSIIVSNHPEINNAIQSVVPTPSLTVGTRVDDNNNMILVIGGMDIIPMDNALVRRIESYEFLTYSNSMVSVTNVVTNGMSGSNISSSRFTMYTPTNDVPMTFNGSAPSTPFGPGLLYYTANESFFVSRPDVATTIFSMFNVSSTLPPPPATMTPIPGVTISPGDPSTAFVLNSNGSSWDPQAYTQCSRTCGGGIRVRQLKCRTLAGDNVRTCTQPTEPSSTDIPPSIELCNLQDCNNPNMIHTVPAPDVQEVNMTVNGQPSGDIYGRGIYYITSSVADDTYMITFNSRCTETGSTYNIVQERVNGALAINNNINLETSLVDRRLSSSINDFTINYSYNGIMFPITVIRSDGFPSDEVLTTTTSVSYNNRVLSFDGRNISGVTMVTKLDKLQAIMFLNSFPMDEPGPVTLAISHRNNKVLLTRDFMNELTTPYNNLRGTLQAPMIDETRPTPTPPLVTRTDDVFQVGTPVVQVLEELHRLSLSCRVADNGVPDRVSYSWSKDGVPIVSDNVNYLISGDTLTIQTTDDPQDEGNYTCTVDNGYRTDSARTQVIIEQEQVTTPPPVVTPEPPQPMWVTYPFSDCFKVCNGSVRVRAVLCMLSGQPSTQCSASDMPPSFDICNTHDCPGTITSRRGIPQNDIAVITRTVPNGNFETVVNITNSDFLGGNYQLMLRAVYPDGTIVTNTQSRSNFQSPVSSDATVVFGTPLFGKLEAIKTGPRIDIVAGKTVHSVQPLLGDVCYPWSSIDQFIYSGKTIYSTSLPAPVTNINFLVQITHDGVFNYDLNTNQVFNGPQLLCVSPFNGRAFVTSVFSLAEDITGNHHNITATYFEPPMIASGNGTLDTQRVAMIGVGADIIAGNGSYIRIQGIMEQPGVPVAVNPVWKHNGEVVVSDIGKGRFISDNGFELIISSLDFNHAGTYSFSVSNVAGSDMEFTDVTYVPRQGISVGPQPPNPDSSTLDVGIGLNYVGVNASMVSTVRVFCPSTSTGGTTAYTINGGAEIATDVLTHSPANPSGSCVRYECRLRVSGVTFTRMSMVCFETPTSPSNVTITGNRRIPTGGYSLLTCTAAGVPKPTVFFNSVMIGSNGIISDFMVNPNGSLSILNAKNNDNTQYCCTAVNENGNATTCTGIVVMAPPMILRVSGPVTNAPLPEGVSQPMSEFTFHIGQTAQVVTRTTVNIECNATGSPAPSYAWFKDGVQLTGSDAIGRVYRIELANPTDGHDGVYECSVSNEFGSDTALSRISFISPPNVPNSNTNVGEILNDGGVVSVNQMTSVKVKAGTDFCVLCEPDLGSPPAEEVTWRRRSLEGTEHEGIDISDVCITVHDNGTRLCFTDVSSAYSDVYSCFVSNEAGSDSGDINIQVSVPTVIRQSSRRDIPSPSSCLDQRSQSFVNEEVGVNVCMSFGTRVLVDCVVNEDACPTPVVTWQIYNSSSGTNVQVFNGSGVTIFPNNSLSIDSLSMNSLYTCVADPPGNTTDLVSVQSQLNVSGVAPMIAVSPTFRPVNVGSRRILSVGTGRREVVRIQLMDEIQILCPSSGSPTPVVSWTAGGRPVVDDNVAFDVQSDGSLLIRSLASTACVEYTCTATNPVSSVSQSVTVCGETYQCLQTGLSPCTTTCGLGAQRFIFECNRTVDTGPPSPINLLFVPLTLRPRQQAQQCQGLSPCPDEEFRYTTTEFSSCSHSCNCGKMSRTVTCHLFRSGVRVEQVDYSACQLYANQSQFPSNLTMDCNVYPCPDWRAGDWTMCNRTCSGGYRTRNISCVSSVTNMTIDDRFCTAGTEPRTIEQCNIHLCPYQYVADRWSECSSTCRGGIRTRTVRCYNVMTQQFIDSSLCAAEGLTPPPTTHICGVGDCPPIYSWVVSHYGSCSVSCGRGTQSRNVTCQDIITQSTIDDSFCSARRKPDTMRICDTGAPCPNAACVAESFLCAAVPSAMCSIGAIRDACCISCP